MGIVRAVSQWLFVLCLPVMLLTASIAWAVNSLWLYRHGFETYNISQVTGLAPSELDKAANGLVRYFNSDEPTISLAVVKDGKTLPLFNEREVIHLRDVKGLIWLDYRVLFLTLAYVAGYACASLFWKRRRQLAWGMASGGGLTLALMLVVGVGILLDFDRLFLQFHLISFTNPFWQLDPARDYLIMLFPEGFWYDAARYIALATALGAAVVGGVGGGYLLAKRRATKGTS